MKNNPQDAIKQVMRALDLSRGIRPDDMQQALQAAKNLQVQFDNLSEHNRVLREALEKLSTLGNEPELGNSIGNQIAQAALSLTNKPKEGE